MPVQTTIRATFDQFRDLVEVIRLIDVPLLEVRVGDLDDKRMHVTLPIAGKRLAAILDSAGIEDPIDAAMDAHCDDYGL